MKQRVFLFAEKYRFLALVESCRLFACSQLIGICTPADNHTNDQRLHASPLSRSEHGLLGIIINKNDLGKLAVGYLDVLLWNRHNLCYSGENTGVCFPTVVTVTNTSQFFFLIQDNYTYCLFTALHMYHFCFYLLISL